MLIQKGQNAVVIFNMQLEIIPLLENGTSLLNNCCWLADLCADLEVPNIVIEHKKLGKLSQALKDVARTAQFVEKDHFDFLAHEEIANTFNQIDAPQVVLAGGETHVCLLQSALNLLQAGKQVFVLSDTCSSRNQADHDAALLRMQQQGVQLITREMYFFEILRHSEHAGYIDLAMKYLDGRYIR